MGGVVKAISGFLFGADEPKAVEIPEPTIPAVPAPNRREDTGANIVVGSDAGKNKRVSGRKSGSGSGSSGGDVLGGLGRGGLSI
jgi:hypothetical protein